MTIATHAAASRTLLVAGAGGLIGSAAVERFAADARWRVLALGRRTLALPDGVVRVTLDLTDAAACREVIARLGRVTHVLYAALYEKPDLVAGWRDPQQMAVNAAMLRNLLDALAQPGSALRHVTVLQGTKAYGSHIEPPPVPCREDAPRHQHENFYWLQEDLLRERQPKAAWTFSILRPQVVFGHALASPMNIVAAIGAYASLQRELGTPLSFPGGGRFVNAASDSRLIAAAVEFCMTHEVAANETYNVVNGDALQWHETFGAVARHFGMPTAAPHPQALAVEMPRLAGVWARIADRHSLASPSLAELIGSSWQFADRMFAHGVQAPPHALLSPIKLRNHGFHDCVDSTESLLHWLDRLQRARLLPP